jgi:hypothetical protein
MTFLTWARKHRRNRRRPRPTELAIESIERRLAPSPTLPLPPPHVPSEVAGFEPPDPCAKPATTFAPPEPCFDAPPEPC